MAGPKWERAVINKSDGEISGDEEFFLCGEYWRLMKKARAYYSFSEELKIIITLFSTCLSF